MSAEEEVLRDALQKATDEKNLIKNKALEIVKRCKVLESEKEYLAAQLAQSQAKNEEALVAAGANGGSSAATEAELAKYKAALDKAVAKLKSQKAALDAAVEEKNSILASQSPCIGGNSNSAEEINNAVQAAIAATAAEKDAIIATLNDAHARALAAGAGAEASTEASAEDLSRYKAALDKAVSKLKSQKTQLDSEHERLVQTVATLEQKEQELAALHSAHAAHKADTNTSAEQRHKQIEEMQRKHAALETQHNQAKLDRDAHVMSRKHLEETLHAAQQEAAQMREQIKALQASAGAADVASLQLQTLQDQLGDERAELESSNAVCAAQKAELQLLQDQHAQLNASLHAAQAAAASSSLLQEELRLAKEQLSASELEVERESEFRMSNDLVTLGNRNAADDLVALQAVFSLKEAAMEEKTASLKAAQAALQVSQAETEDTATELEGLRRELAAERASHSSAISTHLEQAERTLQAHKEDAELRHKQIEEMQRKHAALETQHNQAKLDRDAHVMSRKHLEETLHAAQQEAAQMREQVDKAAVTLEENAREIDTYISEQQELVGQMRDLEEAAQERVAEISRLTSEKNAALATVTAHASSSSDFDKQLAAMQESLQAAQASLGEKEEALAAALTALAEKEAAIKDSANVVDSTVAHMETQLAETSQRLFSLQQEHDIVTSTHRELGTMHGSVTDTLTSLQEQYAALQKEHETLSASHADFKGTAKKHITTLKTQVETTQVALSEKESELAALSATHESKVSELASLAADHEAKAEGANSERDKVATALAAAEQKLIQSLEAALADREQAVADKDAVSAEFEIYRTKSKSILQKATKEKLTLEEDMAKKLSVAQAQVELQEQALAKAQNELNDSEMAHQQKLDELQMHLERASHDAQEHLNKLNEREMQLMDYRDRQEEEPLAAEQYEYLRQAFVKLFHVNKSTKTGAGAVHRLEGKHLGIARVICAILNLRDEEAREVIDGVKVYSEALQAQALNDSYQYSLEATRETVSSWMSAVFPSAATTASPSSTSASPAPTPAPTPMKANARGVPGASGQTTVSSPGPDSPITSGLSRSGSDVSVDIDD